VWSHFLCTQRTPAWIGAEGAQVIAMQGLLVSLQDHDVERDPDCFCLIERVVIFPLDKGTWGLHAASCLLRDLGTGPKCTCPHKQTLTYLYHIVKDNKLVSIKTRKQVWVTSTSVGLATTPATLAWRSPVPLCADPSRCPLRAQELTSHKSCTSCNTYIPSASHQALPNKYYARYLILFMTSHLALL